jgi:hypothetical protein
MSLLVAAPGMLLDEVQRRSDVALGVHRREDGSGVAQPRRPHAVHIDHATHGFLVPESLFTVLELTSDRVVRLVASPQLEAMSLEKATREAVLLTEAMERAGWTSEVPMPCAPSSPEVGDTLLGVWRVDDWRSTLMLRPVFLPTAGYEHEELAWILSLTVDAVAG